MGHSIDMEKVIEALHCRAYDDDFPCWKCAYYKQDEKPVARCDYRGLMDDAITLLKEQKAVEPKKVKGYNPPMYTLYEYECEKCKSPMMNKQPFCMGCGRQVKWE